MGFRSRAAFALTLTALVVAPRQASAYIGPGAGLGAIGAVVVFVAVFLVAAVGIVLFPLRLMIKKLRKSKAASAETTDTV
jgi:hypothetical protein